jgi:hypothetical protein
MPKTGKTSVEEWEKRGLRDICHFMIRNKSLERVMIKQAKYETHGLECCHKQRAKNKIHGSAP